MKCLRCLNILVLVLAVAIMSACSGGEAKRDKFLSKGQTNFNAGDYTAARLDVKNALQIDPKFSPGYLLLGRTELKLKNFKAAYGAFSGAVKYDAENMEAQIELGRLLLAARQPDKAIEKADLALGRNKNNIEATILKASALLLQKKPSEAIALLEKTVGPDLKVPQAFSVLAMSYFQEKQLGKGQQTLLRGIEANPDAVPLRLLLARVEAGNKNLEAAADQLKVAIKLQPDNWMLPYQLADLYWAFQQMDQAMSIVRAQVENQSENEDVYLRAAQFLVGKKELGETEKLLSEGIAKIVDSFKLRFALSDVLVKQKKVDQAMTVLRDCLSLSKDSANPDIVTTHLSLARLHLMLRDVSAARSETNQVLSVSPKNSDGRYLLGQILIIEGKPDAAIPEFRIVVGERPDFVPAYLMLTRAHLLAKQPELAMDVLGKALEVKPDAPDILRAMAVLRTRNKDYAGAEANLRKILEKTPEDLRTRTQLGDLLFYTNNFDKAELEYNHLVREQDKKPLGYLRLGRLYAKQQQWDKAEKILRQGQANNPDEPAFVAPLVQILLQSHHVEAAETVCHEAIKRWPDRAIGYALLGQLRMQKQQYAEAESQLRKAVQVEPNWQLPYNLLAKLYVDQGKQGEAIKELEALKKADPENIRNYFTLAQLYEKSGQYDGAIDTYRTLLTKQPDSWAASNNLAYLLSTRHSDSKSLDEALILVETAIKSRPDESTVLDTLGWVQYQRGEPGKALAAFEEALVKDSDNASTNYHAAVVLHALHRSEEAREKLAIALRDDKFADREAAEKLNAFISRQEGK